MSAFEVQWRPNDGQLRWFATLQVAFFAAVGHALHHHAGFGRTAALAVVAASAMVGVAGLIWPPVIRVVYVVWMTLVFPIGWLVSHAILAVLYFLVFTPTGLLLRCFGYDPLQLRGDRSATTYWRPHVQRSRAEDYFRQF